MTSSCSKLKNNSVSSISKAGSSPTLMLIIDSLASPHDMVRIVNNKPESKLIIKLVPKPATKSWYFDEKHTILNHERVLVEFQMYKHIQQQLLNRHVSRWFPYTIDMADKSTCSFQQIQSIMENTRQQTQFKARLYDLLLAMSTGTDVDSNDNDPEEDEDDSEYRQLQEEKLFATNPLTRKKMQLDMDTVLEQTELYFIANEFIPGFTRDISTISDMIYEFHHHRHPFTLPNVCEVLALVFYNFIQLAKIGITHNDAHLSNIILTRSRRTFETSNVVETKQFIIVTHTGCYKFNPIGEPVVFDFDFAVRRGPPSKLFIARDRRDGHCDHYHAKRDLMKVLADVFRSSLRAKGKTPQEMFVSSKMEHVRELTKYLLTAMFPSSFHAAVLEIILEAADRKKYSGAWLRTKQEKISKLCDDTLLDKMFDLDTIFANMAEPYRFDPSDKPVIDAYVRQCPNRQSVDWNVYIDHSHTQDRPVIMKRLFGNK